MWDYFNYYFIHLCWADTNYINVNKSYIKVFINHDMSATPVY